MSRAKDARVAIYVRVSTSSQSIDPQESALREFALRRDWTNVRVYADRAVSGTQDRRPGLDELMAACRKRQIDTILVWKLDRLGRSLRHLIEALEEFRQLGIAFVSATEGVDSSTPPGRMFFALIAIFANFERDLIAERVKLGLTEARRKGIRLGRPPISTLTPEQTKALLRERSDGKASLRALARKFGVSLWRAHSICRSAG